MEYGTAGFRAHNQKLDKIMFGVGLVSVLRSRELNKTVGVMITASHNPPEDNGVKIVEPMGEMLIEEWERIAVRICNSTNQISEYNLVEKERNILTKTAKVCLARDTRPSGLRFLSIIKQAVNEVNGELIDLGVLSTPQLHFITRCLNDSSYGIASEVGYIQKLKSAFNSKVDVQVDCANGVGALALSKFELHFLLTNISQDPEKLNVKCGADYVKTNVCPPENCKMEQNKLYASLDGDADRIVFYTFLDKFILLDGDRIACLIAEYLCPFVSVGVVQTAYANGASTMYLKSKNIPVVITKTGVKNLHHEAQKFECGVYFEANGHGTVVLSNEARSKLKDIAPLINETVGDAISDLFLVCHILNKKSVKSWVEMYTDFPSKLSKLKVKNPKIFKTTDADQKLLEPDIQPKINELMKKYNGRAFVRPSGTEDVVRIYSEANTQSDLNKLTTEVINLVNKFA